MFLALFSRWLQWKQAWHFILWKNKSDVRPNSPKSPPAKKPDDIKAKSPTSNKEPQADDNDNANAAGSSS